MNEAGLEWPAPLWYCRTQQVVQGSTIKSACIKARFWYLALRNTTRSNCGSKKYLVSSKAIINVRTAQTWDMDSNFYAVQNTRTPGSSKHARSYLLSCGLKKFNPLRLLGIDKSWQFKLETCQKIVDIDPKLRGSFLT